MLIFGSYFAHRSGPNNSDKGRAAIVSTARAAISGRLIDYHISMRHITLSQMEEIAMMPTMKIGKNVLGRTSRYLGSLSYTIP
jgi:hypothetical protein